RGERRAEDLVGRIGRQKAPEDPDADHQSQQSKAHPGGWRNRAQPCESRRASRPHPIAAVRSRGVSRVVAMSDARFATMYTATRISATASTVGASRARTASMRK